MSKFLYGASVQGIQSFIFQTNKLQEIVGASELVEEICTDFFKKTVENFKDQNLILGAAGNIKYIFDKREECAVLVKDFPKAVMEEAPGITVSQAVVEYEENGLNDALQDLEDKLREQRNKVSVPFETGFMGTERSRRTNGVAFIKRIKRKGGDEIIDEATHLKRLKGDPYYSEKYSDKTKETLFQKVSGLKSNEYSVKEDILFDMDDMNYSWLAVIHADGNGLGAIIQNLNESFGNDDNKVKKGFKQFSQAMETATENAAQFAFKEVVKNEKQDGKPYPMRPIVLGGDDLTVIIRADLAFDFTKSFLEEFEEQTRNELKFLKNDFRIDEFKEGITACAGIAYVKNSYPFHYAIDLAEKLCADAKNFVKGRAEYKAPGLHPPFKSKMVPQSSLAFFRVQDSFIEESLGDMKERVLIGDYINFKYGPYLTGDKEVENSFAHVKELKYKLNTIKAQGEKADKDESNGISKLRQWVTTIYRDKTQADFFLNRMKTVNDEFYKKMEMDDEREKKKSIIYDVIQLNTLQKQH